MTRELPPSEPTLSLDTARQIDRLCEAFEKAWIDGSQPKMEDYLLGTSDELRRELVRELIQIDLFYRRRRGENPSPSEYTDRFVEIESDWMAALISSAGRSRRGGGRSGTGAAPTLDSIKPQTPSNQIGALRYFGDYELLEEIARGGMGVVFKARQVTLNRLVAVKMILSGQLASPADVERFHAEAEAAANLDHPGIVPIFEVGEYQGQHYFSMGFVDGRSLSARVTDGPVPSREAAQLVRTVCDAVQYAHEHQVIHRDLKPANILLDRDGRPRVTDFGLAKRVQDESGLTATGQVLGTPSFMPPEQAAGKMDLVGPAADVYSLGAILYTLLTGRPPFQAASGVDTLRQVLEKEPLSPSDLIPGVPRDLETIILKCLEKSIPKRYDSARELADDLQRLLDGRPIKARPVSRWEHGWRWCRRNPAVASLISAVAASLVIGAAVSMFFALQSSRQAEANLLLAKQESGARADAESQRNSAVDNARMARHRLYLANMDLAQSAWDQNHIEALLDLLTRTTPKTGETDFRGFEWYFWNRMCHSEMATFELGHLGGETFNITTSSTDPDGHFYAYAKDDNTVTLWDVAKKTNVMTLKGHSDSITRITFSPDSICLATGSRDKTIKLWSIASGKETATLKGHDGEVTQIAFSNDGRKLAASGSDKNITLWDLATGEVLKTFAVHGDTVHQLAFSTDGKLSAYSRIPERITQWDVITGAESTAVMEQLKDNASTMALGCAFSHDGKRLAIGDWDKTIRLWDVGSGKLLMTLRGHRGAVWGVAFNPDDKHVASASADTTIKLWDVETGQETMTLKGHTEQINDIMYSVDGKRVVSVSAQGVIKLWDVTHERNPHSFKSELSMGEHLIAFSPDGKRLVSAGFGIDCWDVATKEHSLRLTDNVWIRSLAYSPNGSQIAGACTDKVVRLWDAANGMRTRTLEGHLNDVSSIAFTPDGKYLASASAEAIKLWDLATGMESRTWRQWDYDFCIAFSPDGRTLAVYNGTIKLWDVVTGKLTMTMELTDDEVLGVSALDGKRIAFSPDGKYLASAGTHSIKLWDVSTGKVLKSLKGHGLWTMSLAFSPDSKRLATASHDMTVKLWDVATGQETLTLVGHTEVVNCVAFSPNGNQLASSSADGTIKLWNASPFVGNNVHDEIAR